MDWYLHKQVLARMWPFVLIVSFLWTAAAYLYLDPLAALGFTAASKASWGRAPNEALINMLVISMGPVLTLPAVGNYVRAFRQFRKQGRGGKNFERENIQYGLIVGTGLLGGMCGLLLVLGYLSYMKS